MRRALQPAALRASRRARLLLIEVRRRVSIRGGEAVSAHHWHRPKTRAMLLRGEEPAWITRHKRREYVIRAIIATPPWVDVKALRALAHRRDVLTRSTGVRHVLDHIVPLTHPLVSGLNVPENIQIIPAGTNALKLNGWCEWHGDLFAGLPPPPPVTLSLFAAGAA